MTRRRRPPARGALDSAPEAAEHGGVPLVTGRLPSFALALVCAGTCAYGCSLERGGLERPRDRPMTDGAVAVRDGAGDAATSCPTPASCACTPGATRTVSCAMCGMQGQRCSPAGSWLDEGACGGVGACAAGAREMGASCGACGTMQRECTAGCSWGAWTCAGMGECMAGTPGSEDQPCGTCGGTQTHTRTCDPTCHWGAWGPWSACTMTTVACTPGAMESGSQSCGCSDAGTQSRVRTCEPTCTWGAWSGWGACMGDRHCRTITGMDVCPGWEGACWRCRSDGGWEWAC